MGKDFVDLRHAKSKDYCAVLKEIKKEGKCPFCPENFRWHPKPILENYQRWFLTEANWPYENARKHFLIICKEHKEDFLTLTPNDFSEVYELVSQAIEDFRIRGGAVTLRFGDTAYTGATVKHLHFHLIVPKKRKVVDFPIG